MLRAALLSPNELFIQSVESVGCAACQEVRHKLCRLEGLDGLLRIVGFESGRRKNIFVVTCLLEPVEKLSTALPRALSTDGSLVASMPWRYSCVETLWIKHDAPECRGPSRLQYPKES